MVRSPKKTNNQNPYYDMRSLQKIIIREQVLPIIFAVVFGSGLLIVLFLILVKPDMEKRIEKNSIKNRLSAMIKNGASIDDVKHAYNVRDIERPNPFKRIDEKLFYSEDTSLSLILLDMRADYYSSKEKQSDSTYLSRLSFIIQENQYTYPFDNLEDLQSRSFKDLKTKLGDDYSLVQDEVNQISTELYNKNQLVSKYLKSSKTSLFLSLSALLITIVVSIWQLIQGVNMKKQLYNINTFFPKESKVDDK